MGFLSWLDHGSHITEELRIHVLKLLPGFDNGVVKALGKRPELPPNRWKHCRNAVRQSKDFHDTAAFSVMGDCKSAMTGTSLDFSFPVAANAVSALFRRSSHSTSIDENPPEKRDPRGLGHAPDAVTVDIPASNATNGEVFARLRAIMP